MLHQLLPLQSQEKFIRYSDFGLSMIGKILPVNPVVCSLIIDTLNSRL